MAQAGSSGTSGSGGSGGSTTTVRYEQNNLAVHYTGTGIPTDGSFNSGGSAVLAMDAGSQATFTFTGTGVKWIGFSDPWSGIAIVYLDGVIEATIDTYSAVYVAQKVQYAVSGLTNASHTLMIYVNGTKDSSSSGDWVWVDAFDVTRVTAGRLPYRTEPP